MRNGAEASSPCIEDLLACSHRGKRVDTTESQGKVLNLTEIAYLKRQTGKDLAHAFCILLLISCWRLWPKQFLRGRTMGSRPRKMADGIGYQEVERGDLDYLL